MTFYIRVENNQPVGHPILEENLLQAHPGIDLNNLPSEFAVFERIIAPVPGVYEVYTGCTYERDGDVFKDTHHFREMTVEEKTAKQNAIKDGFNRSAGYASWTFNEATCTFDPPVPFPEDRTQFLWDEETTSWQPIPQQP